MNKIVTGYLINNDVLVLENGSFPAGLNAKRVNVVIDKVCIDQWNEELMLGITDDWEEDEE